MRARNWLSIGVISVVLGSMPAIAAKQAPPALQKAAAQCFGKEKVGWPDLILACNLVLKAKLNAPQKAAAYFNRGAAYLRIGGGRNALADFNEALKINPKFARALEARAAILIGQKKLDLALADLNKAISLDGKSSTAYNNRGMLYLSKKDPAKAISDLTKAIELEPNDPASYAARGTAYVAKADPANAMADFDKALQLDSSMTVARYNRGMLFAMRGDKDKARSDFQAILATDPDNKGAKEALAALDRKKGGA